MSKGKRLIISTIIIGSLVLCIFVILKIGRIPTILVESPKNKVELEDNRELKIPIRVKNLPKGEFPATSMSISFDKRKLEFIKVDDGTMEVYDNYAKNVSDEVNYKIPNWAYNVDAANGDGIINTMYLDTTAGKNAYSKDGYDKGGKDILVNLVFKLKGSALQGEKLDIKIEDATLAKVNGEVDKTSYSTKDGYEKLAVKSGEIVVAK